MNSLTFSPQSFPASEPKALPPNGEEKLPQEEEISSELLESGKKGLLGQRVKKKDLKNDLQAYLEEYDHFGKQWCRGSNFLREQIDENSADYRSSQEGYRLQRLILNKEREEESRLENRLSKEIAASSAAMPRFQPPKRAVTANGVHVEATAIDRRRLVEGRKRQAVEAMKLDASLAATASFLTKGLDRGEATEVLQAANDAAYGATIDEVTAPLATAGRLLNAAFSAGAKVVKTVVKGQAHEYCSSAYHPPGAPSGEQCLSLLTNAIDGNDPEVNLAVATAAKAVASTLPEWSIKAAKAVMKAEEALLHFDQQMVEKYHTIPGTIHESLSMAAGVGGGMVVGAAFKGGVGVAKEAIREGAPLLKAGKSSLPLLWNRSTIPLQQPLFLLRLFDAHFPLLDPLATTTMGRCPLMTRQWNLSQEGSSFRINRFDSNGMRPSARLLAENETQQRFNSASLFREVKMSPSEKERLLRQRQLPALEKLPEEMPRHLNEFLHKAEVSQLYCDGVSATFYHTPFVTPRGPSALYLFAKSKPRHHASMGKVQGGALITAPQKMNALERANYALEALFNDARHSHQSRTYILFDDRKSGNLAPIMTAMESRPEKIVTKTPFSKGRGQRPMILLEVELDTKPIHREVAHNTVVSSRIDYSKDYVASKKEFSEAKEFNGKLSKDLCIIQYHNSAPLGKGRSHKWFMPVIQGNRCTTVDEIQEVIAKLSSWGEITEVTLAKIPAGEPVRFYHGKAKPQVDKVTGETRCGGGIQYRFFDFDPNWVVCRKALP